MSVIPFVLEGENQSVVTTTEEFTNSGGVNGNTILIKEFDKNQLTECNASYDLCVGDEYRDHTESGKTDLGEGDFIILPPNGAVIIETAEYVHFSHNRLGHIVPKVSLLQKGISNTSSKIDPGYHGKLLISVFNLGRQKVRLRKGDKFCTLYVIEVKEGVRPYDKLPKTITGQRKVRPFSKLGKYISAHQASLGFWLALAVVLLELGQLLVSWLVSK
jgi:deoxycytidine triphosphate deaminase